MITAPSLDGVYLQMRGIARFTFRATRTFRPTPSASMARVRSWRNWSVSTATLNGGFHPKADASGTKRQISTTRCVGASAAGSSRGYWFGRNGYSRGLSVGRGVLPATGRASLCLPGKGSGRGLLSLGGA